jgi:opacity protein-like surface antigen
LFGHGKIFSQNLYLGIEAWVQPWGHKKSHQEERLRMLSLEIGHTMVCQSVVRVGYGLGHWLPFISVGMSYTPITVQSSLLKDKYHCRGMVWGVGIDVDLSQRLKMGMSYSTIHYPKFNHGDTGIRPSIHHVKLRWMVPF